jgi:hypothetical protein
MKIHEIRIRGTGRRNKGRVWRGGVKNCGARPGKVSLASPQTRLKGDALNLLGYVNFDFINEQDKPPK